MEKSTVSNLKYFSTQVWSCEADWIKGDDFICGWAAGADKNVQHLWLWNSRAKDKNCQSFSIQGWEGELAPDC